MTTPPPATAAATIEGTVLAAVVADVIEAAVALGASHQALLEASGLTAAQLSDPDARVPVAADVAVWRALQDRPMGLAIGERLGATSLGAVGYAMQHGRTVREALEWLHRFRAVLHPGLVPTTEVRSTAAGDRLVFSKVMAGPFAQLREPVFAFASGMRALMRGLTGEAVTVRSVTYPLPRPANAAEHEQWFTCPVAWGGAVFEMAFDASWLDWPLPKQDARLSGYLTQQAQRLLDNIADNDSVTAQVRRDVAMALADGEPRQDGVAKRLGMSARTLQRRLSTESTTFAMIVDDVRRERAELLLNEGRLTASEVAFLLGFSEPAPFFRAFRRWTGGTVQSWRSQQPSQRQRHTSIS
ncbi:MAG: AraC family transcriptional regulator [Gemmatimonadaceae bacterium]|nr:AraC family transcriptional regulator [Gemmatimonadaceae bacterium]